MRVTANWGLAGAAVVVVLAAGGACAGAKQREAVCAAAPPPGDETLRARAEAEARGDTVAMAAIDNQPLAAWAASVAPRHRIDVSGLGPFGPHELQAALTTA